jgi:hypothetical protein
MILGSKPIAEMSEGEMLSAIEELRGSREALRNEAIKKKKEMEAKGITADIPKTRRAPKVDPLASDMLAFLRGDKDDL